MKSKNKIKYNKNLPCRNAFVTLWHFPCILGKILEQKWFSKLHVTNDLWCNSLATFLFSLEWLRETPFVWLHNCVYIGQSTVILWNAFSSRQVANHKSLQLIISFWTYHHCNFVHDKVFAGFDNFPGQNII